MKSVDFLGERLELIFNLASQAQSQENGRERCYDRIWDCCCDHGYLGIKMLQDKTAGTICFVDQVPHITEKISAYLSKTDFTNYQVLTADAAALRFDQHERHLVIVAGVTGNNVINILQSIIEKFSCESAGNAPSLDFIVCPTRGAYDVRRFMRDNNFGLKDEFLVTEKKRQYEVMFVDISKDVDIKRDVSEVGEMWTAGNSDHLSYLRDRVRHYQKESQIIQRTEASKALSYYRNLLRHCER